jgi:hypothetical protein
MWDVHVGNWEERGLREWREGDRNEDNEKV